MKLHLAHSFRSLLFFLAAGMFFFSCEKNEDEPERSSEASIISLTLTIEGNDYEVTFEDKQATIPIPYVFTEFSDPITVKAVQLSAKAKGIKVGDKITIPISTPLTFTVTAEDNKTKGVYTVYILVLLDG